MYRAKSEAKRAGRGRATQGTGKEPAHRGRRRARRARESRGGGDSRTAASCRIGTARSRHRASSSPAALSRRYLAQCGTLECSRSRSFRGLRVLDGPSGVQKMGPPDHDRMMGHYLGVDTFWHTACRTHSFLQSHDLLELGPFQSVAVKQISHSMSQSCDTDHTEPHPTWRTRLHYRL